MAFPGRCLTQVRQADLKEKVNRGGRSLFYCTNRATEGAEGLTEEKAIRHEGGGCCCVDAGVTLTVGGFTALAPLCVFFNFCFLEKCRLHHHLELNFLCFPVLRLVVCQEVIRPEGAAVCCRRYSHCRWFHRVSATAFFFCFFCFFFSTYFLRNVDDIIILN